MTSNDSLAQLSQILASRKGGDPQSSYTARLLQKGPDAFLKKIGEEATELVMACKDADHGGHSHTIKEKIVYETADLWYHSLVALTHYGLSATDVIAELDKRVGTSGLEEKASRKASDRENHESKGVQP